MKALQLFDFGGPEALVLADVPVPAIGAGEVLIRVMASGVNFAETLMRQNRYAVTPPLPSILGAEVAGIIEAVGSDVQRFKTGDRVAGSLFAAGQFFGGYAQYAACAADFVTPIPDQVPFEHAVALMVQGLTAVHLLERAPAAGKQILVSAAAGGVGSLLVQLAKRAGARQVIAAASTEEKRAFARSLGADSVVDYTAPDWAQVARGLTGGTGVDVVYESAGGSVTRESLKALAPLGQIIIFGALNIQDFSLGVPELLGLIFQNQTVTGFATAPLLTPQGLAKDLSRLFGMSANGEIEVTIGRIYPLEQAAEAHRALEARHTRGKIVLAP